MLSIEDPPDPPPCAPPKADDDHHYQLQQLPAFSIRDYVFTTRHKHIEKNWPFSERHLPQFSPHEIKDLLPPFEPPDSVRKQSLSKAHRPLLSQVYSKKVEVSTFLKEERYLGNTPLLLEEQDNLALYPRLSGKLGSDHAARVTVAKEAQSKRESSPSDKVLPLSLLKNHSTLLKSPVDLQTSQLPFLPENNNPTVGPSGWKCRLILKLGPIADTSRVEDIKSNTAFIPDAMASKVCPVCKIFSSSSNTTLNAHIDQCLAIESTSKWVTNVRKVTEYSIKPTKKRSMVNIYATAPRCTLEELDRRNGTNWAADKTAIVNVTADDKTQRVSDVDHKCTNDKSPIYVDSNGTKLRIISKFSNVLMPTAEDEPMKLVKNIKASKGLSSYAEKHCQLKSIKRPKPKPRNKNFCFLESNEDGTPRAREEKRGMENGRDKEESTSQLSKACNEVNCSNSGTLRHWVCSKRTSRLKRVSSKDNHLDLGLPSSKSTNALIDRNKRNFGCSFGKSCAISRPSENMVSFTNTRYAKSPVYESQVDCTVDSHNRHVGNRFTRKRTTSQRGGSVLSFPKSSGEFASCPSKGVQVAGTADNADNFLKKSVLSSEFMVKVKPSIPIVMSKWNGKQSALRKPRLRRYIAEIDGQLGTRKCAFGGVEVLNIPMATEDSSQRWDLDVGTTMKSQSVGISSSDSQWQIDPPPGSNKILLTQDRNMAVDRDSSTSPVSTISHPTTIQRCNSHFLDIESHGGDPEKISFSGVSCEGATVISPSEESVNLNEDQPCCCFWKWASSLDASPTYQLLKQGTTKSSMSHAKMSYTSTSIGSLSPVSGVSDMYQSPRNSVPEHPYPDAGHNREAQSVLRLMGKNLVVVSKDVKLRQPLFADSSTKHTNLLRLSPGSISESTGLSSQDSCNLQPHIFNELKSVQNQHSSREVILIDDCPESEAQLKYSSAAGILPLTASTQMQMSSIPFHPFLGMDTNLSSDERAKWGDTFKGDQLTCQNAFASYYSPTLP